MKTEIKIEEIKIEEEKLKEQIDSARKRLNELDKIKYSINIKDELKKLLLEGEVPVESVSTSEISVCVKHKDRIYKERINIADIIEEKLTECYKNLYSSIITPPCIFKYNQAFNEAWLDNVINGIGDAHGETIPSQKQVYAKMKKMKKNK